MENDYQIPNFDMRLQRKVYAAFAWTLNSEDIDGNLANKVATKAKEATISQEVQYGYFKSFEDFYFSFFFSLKGFSFINLAV